MGPSSKFATAKIVQFASRSSSFLKACNWVGCSGGSLPRSGYNRNKAHYFRYFCIALLIINDRKCREMCQRAHAVIAIKRIRSFGWHNHSLFSVCFKQTGMKGAGVGVLYKAF